MDRATQRGHFVLCVRACAQCSSCRIRDEMAVLSPSLFPLGSGAFPFSLQDWSVWANLRNSDQTLASLRESEGVRENLERDCVNLCGFECRSRYLDIFERN